MKNFAVYEKSEDKRIAVKIGFCWPGFIWTGWWLLFARLWEQAGIVFGALAVVSLATVGTAKPHDLDEAMSVVMFVTSIIIGFIVGRKGNKWRRANLRARGFNLVAVVNAESKDGARAELREMSPEKLSAAKKDAPGRIEKIERTRGF